MMIERTDEMRLYFARVKPVFAELYGMAHAVTGNGERAEYCLQRVILEGFLRHRRFGSTRGFRDSLKGNMRRIALAECGESPELTWDAFSQGALDGPAQDPMRRLVEQEDASMRRLLVLRFGCALNVRQIARATGLPARQADLALSRFAKRAKRRLGADQRAHLEARLQDVCREELAAGVAPDVGAAFRTFEAEASGAIKPARLASKIALRLAFVAALVFLAAMIWLVAAVIRPDPLADDGLRTETLVDQ